MIRNEVEYQEAVRRLRQEKGRIGEHRVRLAKAELGPAEIKRALEPLLSFQAQLEEEIVYYERVKRGELGQMNNLHGLGQYLVSLRIAHGLTPKDLADRLGVHVLQVLRDERDEYHNITHNRAVQILEAIGAVCISTFKHPSPKSK